MLALLLLTGLVAARRPQVTYFNKKEFARQLLAKLNSQSTGGHRSVRSRASSQNGFEPVVPGMTQRNLMLFESMLRQPWMFGLSRRQARILLRMAAQSNMRKLSSSQN